jgi:hypothetical protein
MGKQQYPFQKTNREKKAVKKHKQLVIDIGVGLQIIEEHLPIGLFLYFTKNKFFL